MTPWVITEAHAISGSHPLKSSPLQSQCNNASVAGGIFWNISNKTNLTVGSGAEGFYMALSAYLYEIMKNETYQAAASMSHKFTQSQLLSNISTCSGCARDMISLDDCHYPNKLILNCNTGLYIEGLTVLGHTSNDTELLDIADQLSVIAVKSSQWSNPSGFSIGPPSDVRNDGYGTPTFRAMLIRALHEHWSRSQPDSDIARLIGAYLLLQYNSLLEFGQYPGKPWYSPSWTGPPVPHLVLWGQQGAIDLMNSAISLSVDPSISDSPGPTGTGETSMSHRKPLALGPIIGGVTGGVVFLGVIIAVIVVIRLRRRNGTVSRAQILDHSAFTGGRILGESFQPAPPLPSATAPRGRQWLNTQHHIEPFSASPHADPSSSNIGPPPRYKEVVQ
ncbi:hypothetical protein QCA50_008123 [Cerrena zonata]|uniref:Glycoside hydrolase family 76 protein n=1 Tax=Cerrena zonata TaxID=2478898 RepID=A0AAW0GI05_9APHY